MTPHENRLPNQAPPGGIGERGHFFASNWRGFFDGTKGDDTCPEQPNATRDERAEKNRLGGRRWTPKRFDCGSRPKSTPSSWPVASAKASVGLSRRGYAPARWACRTC